LSAAAKGMDAASLSFVMHFLPWAARVFVFPRAHGAYVRCRTSPHRRVTLPPFHPWKFLVFSLVLFPQFVYYVALPIGVPLTS
jgi:hypothetical protein